MERDIQLGFWIEVDGPMGTEFIPRDLVGEVEEHDGAAIPLPDSLRDYCENRKAFSIRERYGYGARLHMPGFLDSTSWCVFDTEQEAIDYLEEFENE